jgi:hypothetical protein
MSQYSQYLYVRTVNPGSVDEYVIVGSNPADVSDGVVGDMDELSPKVARYALVGTGEIHHTAPMYVEDTVA